ncbi:Nn.00g072350.m01.CDS01 [Neocucurbitaria sp. VM-36]
MRLRLTVQRNGLPAANILWSVPDTNSPQAYTITRLLEDVNLVIPLEAAHWGLEHYVVEVGGFECLHFTPVSQALKEDDHVSIRPLMTAEVRARTLTGRHQISDDGRHLVDGVPFGRPYLKASRRPAVRIPPRKRRRLDDAGGEDTTEIAGLLTANGEGDEEPVEGTLLPSGDRQGARSRQGSKSVQFQQPELDEDEDSEEEEEEDDDDDFAPEGDSESDLAMDNASEDDSGSDSGLYAGSGASSSASSTSDSDSDSDSNSSSASDSDSESQASSPPDVLSSRDGSKRQTATLTHVPPGEGRASTKSRNARRTMTNRLRALKKAGELPEDADLSDLRRYEDGKTADIQEETEASTSPPKVSGKRKRLSNEESTDITIEDISELNKRKQELMAKFGEESLGATIQTDAPTLPQTSIIDPAVISSPSSQLPNDEPPAKKETPSKRLRPDTTAIGRILARQAVEPAAKKAKTQPTVEEPPEPEGASDPDFWKSRINLSAFECWEEDFELTAPPFPFKQHWDPTNKLMREKVANKKKGKKGKNNVPRDVPPAEEEEEEEKIILDYDDAPVTETADVEMNAAIENQLRQDVEIAAQTDLPALPDDISTLPDLTSSDIKEGAVIVSKFFAVNPITVTPEISNYKTAVVEREGDSGNGAGTIRLKIAQRDLPKKEKKFDSKGNRIYAAVNGFLMDDDEEEDESLWEGQFSELLEPKLLKAA